MSKVELYAAIRRDHRAGMTMRELERTYNVACSQNPSTVSEPVPSARRVQTVYFADSPDGVDHPSFGVSPFVPANDRGASVVVRGTLSETSACPVAGTIRSTETARRAFDSA
ncbi:hypothetical protein [Streptomyces sp. NPDC048516]|uniref:hypothetical protein n=1 Tax=Streptomyces sp. NPDC048516 TaxID=3365565 RepID=UPI0037246991